MAGDTYEFTRNNIHPTIRASGHPCGVTSRENITFDLPAGVLLHPVTVAPPPVAEVAKTRISIAEILGMEARRKQINAILLEEIEWIGTDGKPFVPAKGVVDEWRFCGMTNIAFIETGFYAAPGKDGEDPRWAEGLGKFAEDDK